MGRFFGTDGIRGRAFEPPLDETTVRRLGAALVAELAQCSASPRVLLAGDTRSSTETLAAWFAEAYQATGGKVVWGGVLPTPAVSSLLRAGDYDAGVVISASHNPAHDNGIKVLGRGGHKLGDEAEAALEARLARTDPVAGPGLPPRREELVHAYVDSVLATHVGGPALSGRSLVVDAAHGAAAGIAGDLLEALGATVVRMASSPDGSNINDGCGATCPEVLAQRVLAEGADGGLALDGDADRAILVDETGAVLDGDDILLAWARNLEQREQLPAHRVVATVMSNFGLEQALCSRGMEMIRCAVGDRAVWLAMNEHGAALGGEQSGHVICAHHTVSGDGLITGTQVLAIAARNGCKVSELSDLVRLPQVLLNVPVQQKRPFDGLPRLATELRSTESRLEGRGRVLLRYSGTEPVARVMIEGDDAGEIDALAENLAATIRKELQ